MGDSTLEEIKSRLFNATLEPWLSDGRTVYALTRNGTSLVNRFSASFQSAGQSHEADKNELISNARLTANAPTDIAFLIAEVERLQKIEAEAKTLTSWVHFGNDGFAHVQKVDFYRLADAINDTE